MSTYLHNENDEQEMVASNRGWSQLLDHMESREDAPTLTALVEDGESTDPDSLAKECKAAKEGAETDVVGILENIINFCDVYESEIILVTNGMTGGDGDVLGGGINGDELKPPMTEGRLLDASGHVHKGKGPGGGQFTGSGSGGDSGKIADHLNDAQAEIKNHIRDFAADLSAGISADDLPSYLGGIKAELESMAEKYGVKLEGGAVTVELDEEKPVSKPEARRQAVADIKGHLKDYANDLIASKKSGAAYSLDGVLGGIGQSLAKMGAAHGLELKGKHLVENVLDASGHLHKGKGSPDGGQFTGKGDEAGKFASKGGEGESDGSDPIGGMRPTKIDRSNYGVAKSPDLEQHLDVLAASESISYLYDSMIGGWGKFGKEDNDIMKAMAKDRLAMLGYSDPYVMKFKGKKGWEKKVVDNSEMDKWRKTEGLTHVVKGYGRDAHGEFNDNTGSFSGGVSIKAKSKGDTLDEGVIVDVRLARGKAEYLVKPHTKASKAKHEKANASPQQGSSYNPDM